MLALSPPAPGFVQQLDEDVRLGSVTPLVADDRLTDVPSALGTLGSQTVVFGASYASINSVPFLAAYSAAGAPEWTWRGEEPDQRPLDLFTASEGQLAVAAVRDSEERIVLRGIEAGSVLWSVTFNEVSPGFPTPELQLCGSTDGARVFALVGGVLGPDLLVALEGADGSVIWARELTVGTTPVAIDCDTQGEVVVALLEAGSAAVLDRVIAFEGVSGAIRFATNTAAALQDGQGRSLCVAQDGSRLFVGNSPQIDTHFNLAAYRLSDGALEWRAALGGSVRALALDPVEPKLVAVTEPMGFSFLSSLTLSTFRPATGQAQWTRSVLPGARRARPVGLSLDPSGQRGALLLDSSPFGSTDEWLNCQTFSLFGGGEIWSATQVLPAQIQGYAGPRWIDAGSGGRVTYARAATAASGSTDVITRALEAVSGVQAWQTVQAFDAAVPRAEALVAVPDSQRVFVSTLDSSGQRTLAALDLPAAGSGLATEAWSLGLASNTFDFGNFGPGTPLALSDDGATLFHLRRSGGFFGDDPVLAGVDSATGALRFELELDDADLPVDLAALGSGSSARAVALLEWLGGTVMRAVDSGGQVLWAADYPAGFETNWWAGDLELDADAGVAAAWVSNSFPVRELRLVVRDLDGGALLSEKAYTQLDFDPETAGSGVPDPIDLLWSAGSGATAAGLEGFVLAEFGATSVSDGGVALARVRGDDGTVVWGTVLDPLVDLAYSTGELVHDAGAGVLVAVVEGVSNIAPTRVAVLGLDDATGALLWSRTLGTTADPREFLDAAAAEDGSQVFVSLRRTDGVAEVQALDAALGAPLWEAELELLSGADRARVLASGAGSVLALQDFTHAVPSGAARLVELVPDLLVSGPEAISIAAPEPLVLALDAAATSAGSAYLVLGSASGTEPGVPVDGVLLPLVPDGYLLQALAGAGQPPFVETLGLLDSNGRARARIEVPGGLDPALAGRVLPHAALEFDPVSLAARAASEPVAVTLVP